MARLDFLVGVWEGTGWFQRGEAPRTRFRQREDVRRKLGGELVVVEGVGWHGDDPDDIVHRAFTVVSYDRERDCYRWEAFSMAGRVETVLQLTDEGFEWSMSPVPAVTMRYQASVTGDSWVETGELLRDHEPEPTTILDMTLHRIGPATER